MYFEMVFVLDWFYVLFEGVDVGVEYDDGVVGCFGVWYEEDVDLCDVER